MMKQEWLKARLQPRLQQCKRAAGFVRSPANSVFLRRGLRQAAGCQRKKGSKKTAAGGNVKHGTWSCYYLLFIQQVSGYILAVGFPLADISLLCFYF